MGNSIDIKRIRLLLERYYRAETTRDEEDCLEAVFCAAEAADIPADMGADMRLFRAMRELHPSGSGCTVPD